MSYLPNYILPLLCFLILVVAPHFDFFTYSNDNMYKSLAAHVAEHDVFTLFVIVVSYVNRKFFSTLEKILLSAVSFLLAIAGILHIFEFSAEASSTYIHNIELLANTYVFFLFQLLKKKVPDKNKIYFLILQCFLGINHSSLITNGSFYTGDIILLNTPNYVLNAIYLTHVLILVVSAYLVNTNNYVLTVVLNLIACESKSTIDSLFFDYLYSPKMPRGDSPTFSIILFKLLFPNDWKALENIEAPSNKCIQ